MSASAIERALGTVIDPELRLPLTELNMIDLTDGLVTVKLTVAGCPAAQKIEADVRAAVAEFDVDVAMTVMSQAERNELKEKLRAGKPPRTNPFDKDTLTRVYLVGSGKGGVGKSSVTTNLAVALAEAGHRVGLIDADIFGFSIPGQLGITEKPTRVDELILPPVAQAGKWGVKVISIGMFLDDNKPVAWRGPMLHRAVEQFLCDVFWGDLDFLLVDLPPGTGDIAISLGQLLPTAKSIVVTTPQVAAAEVAERSGSVGLQTGQSVFGVIENMSWLEQPDGSKFEIFGHGGGLAVAERLSTLSGQAVPQLGQIPISVALREGSDAGLPVVQNHPDDPAARAIREIAVKISQDKIGLAGRLLRVSL
ncbi:Mrp/NBP35 family ATP-binding protein [Rhodoluna limnophila]|uniref:Mrp/NBP35 family ATP-binding protein n=1 Tax=Rhodoluna limnophila TaxID=232537 RepID=UPI001106DA95|nr:Mrp/NBP35 family ATP-binding protein [Rhodoluna limnophila]